MSKKLIHFTADWCGPCKAMKPVIAQFLEENPDVVYEQVNVDVEFEKASEYGVLSIPMFVAEYDGERIDSIKGAVPKARIEGLFKNYK